MMRDEVTLRGSWAFAFLIAKMHYEKQEKDILITAWLL